MKLSFLVSLTAFVALLVWSLPAVTVADTTSKTRHPSYNLMGRDTLPSADSVLNPNFVVAEEAHLTESGFWRSGFLNESLVGLTVTDIDGNGLQEIIYASNSNVYVGRVEGEKLIQLVKYPVSLTESILSVDALDLTGDGRPEIIISIINDSNAAASSILSYSDGKLTPLVTRIPWYLRVVGAPGGYFLAGQRASTDIISTYSGSVMRMEYKDGRVRSAAPVSIPPFINIFNFTLGRLGNSGIQMVAAIKLPSEHLFLFEGSNQAWESRDEYGGTMNYLEPQGVTDGNRKREFIPSRILIADIDRDGQNELIVAQNDRGGVPFMSNQRSFSGGTIQAFKYSNLSLTPFFRTRRLPGPGVDYHLADINNDGIQDLVVAVVTEQKSGMMKEGRSVIVAYELSRPKEPEVTKDKK